MGNHNVAPGAEARQRLLAAKMGNGVLINAKDVLIATNH